MKTNTMKTALLMFMISLVCSTGVWAGERYSDRPQQRMDRQSQRVERDRVGKMQDRAGRHIYQSKHNPANRYGRHPSRIHNFYRPPQYGHRPKSQKHGHYRYRGPYPVHIGSDTGYLVAASFSEPGWTVSFSVGGGW